MEISMVFVLSITDFLDRSPENILEFLERSAGSHLNFDWKTGPLSTREGFILSFRGVRRCGPIHQHSLESPINHSASEYSKLKHLPFQWPGLCKNTTVPSPEAEEGKQYRYILLMIVSTIITWTLQIIAATISYTRWNVADTAPDVRMGHVFYRFSLSITFNISKTGMYLTISRKSRIGWKLAEAPWFLTSVSALETPYAAFSVCLFLFFQTWFQILKKFSITVDLVTRHNLLSLYIDFTNWTHDVSLNHRIEDNWDEERYNCGSNWSHEAYLSSTFNNLGDFRIFLFYVSSFVCLFFCL